MAGLASLLFVGAENVMLFGDENENDFSIQYSKYTFFSNLLEIRRNSDIYWPVLLTVKTREEKGMSLEQFRERMTNAHLDIIVGGQVISRIHLSLAMQLKAPQANELGTEFTICLPHQETIGETLLLIASSFTSHSIRIVHFSVDGFHEPEISLTEKFLAQKMRRNLVANAQELMAQCFDLSARLTWTWGGTFSVNLRGIGRIVKGHFVEGSVSKIKQMSIRVNERVYSSFNRQQLAFVTKKISETCFYFSFPGKEDDFREVTERSFLGCPNYQRLSSVELEFECDDATFGEKNNTCFLRVYSIIGAQIRYANGMARLALANERPVVDVNDNEIHWQRATGFSLLCFRQFLLASNLAKKGQRGCVRVMCCHDLIETIVRQFI